MSAERIFSLAPLTVSGLSPPAIVAAASEAGYGHAGLRLHPASPGEAQWPVIGDTPMRRETRARLRDTGVKVFDFDIIRLDAGIDPGRFMPVLETAAELGARYGLVAIDGDDRAEMIDGFARLSELGSPLGLAFGIEYMPWTGAKTIADARRIVEEAGSGGVLIDAIHVDRSGGTAAGIAAMPADLIAYFQICDLPAERPADVATMIYQARNARLPPGEGGIDVAGMVRALPPGLPISVEVPNTALAATMTASAYARLMLDRTRAFLRAVEGGQPDAA
ncbi:MAG: sugar phosphate isomerase/epimerase [Rhizobiales bacterium]|nr:sugar phosphate isomerase/epimerase [Hyphomicrobiales bacterium]